MSYQVLARKFRPGSFAGLVGQDHVVRALTHALDNDRLHHAYLFTGTRGVGKTTIARVLAKSLNCERGVSSTPCDECSICREVNENRFVDLIEVDAASRTGIDDTRELLENAQYLPTRGRYKVYLIDEVHMLSASSFNALLKTLEEPPEHVKFLLATTEAKKVPVTVLSRCLQFQLKNISAERTASYLASLLEQEGVTFDAGALEVIGRAARGSMRDALSIADQAIAFGQGSLSRESVVEMLGLVGRDEVGSLIEALASGDAARLLAVVGELADRAVDFETLLAELLAEFHRMAVAHSVNADETPAFPPEVVQLYYQIALLGYRDLQIAPDPRAGVEMTLLRMLAFAPDDRGVEVPRTGTPGATAVRDGDSGQSRDAAGPAVRDTGAAEDAGPRVAEDAGLRMAEDAGPRVAEDAGPPAAVAEPTPAPEPQQPRPAGDHGVRLPQPEDLERWYELVAGLKLGGVAKMIAEHTLPVALGAERVELLLDPAHDTLLSDGQVQVIKRALREQLGNKVKLTIEIGEMAGETPAARNARIDSERQQEARTVLEGDVTVRSLLAEFGGRLEEVRPLDDVPTADSGAAGDSGQSEGVSR